jgi:hypothetical protein
LSSSFSYPVSFFVSVQGGACIMLSFSRLFRGRKPKGSALKTPSDQIIQFHEPAEKSRFYWRHSDQYRVLVSEGGQKPPPNLGSPSFIWHLAIWQRDKASMAFLTSAQNIDNVPSITSAQLADEFRYHNAFDEAFFREISNFLRRLQEKGRVSSIASEELQFTPPEQLPDTDESTLRFGVCQPQSLSFTLWWQDGTDRLNPNQAQAVPAPKDLRVRVQAQIHQDHVTLTFYIDAAKPYGEDQIYAERGDIGVRRTRIGEYLDLIRETAKEQIESGAIERDFMPERNISEQQAKLLKEAADYFYSGIWEEFCSSFDIQSVSSEIGSMVLGECFADLRGVMMYVPGTQTKLSEQRELQYEYLREKLGIRGPRPSADEGGSATKGIGPFDIFDNECGEPNTIIKAYWPFIRRATPWADYRDICASGMISWRAIYITALGAGGKFHGSEESPSRDHEVPMGYRNADELNGELNENEPIRFLVLTKGEPHRRQIGRFIERITAIETLRLFALKNVVTIRNASTHIRVIGRKLDGILMAWTLQRAEIDNYIRKKSASLGSDEGDQHGTIRKLIKNKNIDIETPEQLEIMTAKIVLLNKLIDRTEFELITLNAQLDNIGQRGAGRLLHLISRAEYHIDEFQRMSKTLEIGNIDGWINYGQFVSRGLQPTFNLIRRTGQRLSELRTRLQVITETIQTSALIIEAEATRANTQTLRNILASIVWVKRSFITLLLVTISYGGYVLYTKFWTLLRSLWDWLGASALF